MTYTETYIIIEILITEVQIPAKIMWFFYIQEFHYEFDRKHAGICNVRVFTHCGSNCSDKLYSNVLFLIGLTMP